ncbi:MULTISPECIES: hypothetical protein [Streptomyces]|uniref:Uncharacterized protein n=1 Tax=Streptomyces fradiae ATCC 10745 = DSM 40063 TaxID=1319510 RepID=A0A1Y2NXX7_STRFR|nr:MULTISPECIES: hypothetical protein [Streptomyces]OSY52366.1 hypothetical protein BG846_02015 [Streptomyces fradiae ATCC 10745 = DSM 40063]
MYRRVRLRRSGESYVLSLTPAQFELARRVLVDLYGGSHSLEVVGVVAGDASAELLELRGREVDFQSLSSIEVPLSHSDLRVLYGALAFAFLNRSSEEAFHNRYGFYSENVQAVGWAICAALQGAESSM